jgi:hypothetical protein
MRQACGAGTPPTPTTAPCTAHHHHHHPLPRPQEPFSVLALEDLTQSMENALHGMCEAQDQVMFMAMEVMRGTGAPPGPPRHLWESVP